MAMCSVFTSPVALSCRPTESGWYAGKKLVHQELVTSRLVQAWHGLL